MNEKVFVVGIELNNKASYNRFERNNFGMGVPFKILPGLYCIKTNYSTTCEELRDKIVNLFSSQCQVFVMKSNIDLAWRLPDNVASWLNMNI